MIVISGSKKIILAHFQIGTYRRIFHAIIFLLTGLRIYTGEYKAQGPTLCPTEGEGITRAAGFVFACIDTQTS